MILTPPSSRILVIFYRSKDFLDIEYFGYAIGFQVQYMYVSKNHRVQTG
jgi:hypothetical protein